jgi:hypothetical protein
VSLISDLTTELSGAALQRDRHFIHGASAPTHVRETLIYL